MSRLVLLLTFVIFSNAFQQRHEFFSGEDSGGDSIGYRTKSHPTLSTWEQEFILNAKSQCFNGAWMMYSGADFTGTGTRYWWPSDQPYCINSTDLQSKMSLRSLGPDNVSTPSISVYQGEPNNPWNGAELIITSQAGNNFSFVPTAAVITGRSSWTTFSNQDFTGETTCLSIRPGDDMMDYFVGISLPAFSSVISGCDLTDTEIATAINNHNMIN